MCNSDCCAMKTALDLRRQKILTAKLKAELLANPPKTILTPQSQIYSYEIIAEMANYIVRKAGMKPKYGIIVGPALYDILDLMEHRTLIDYEDIPHFPHCMCMGEVGTLFMGTIMAAPVMAFLGRCHNYEGNPMGTCGMPVQVMKLCGVEYLFVSCCSGAVHMDYNEGDILLIKDHINVLGMFGSSPLQGPNEKRFGIRHPRMIDAYDRKMLTKALDIGLEIGYQNSIHMGVYACLGGPYFETPTEQLMLRKIGADAVGMTLVHEVSSNSRCELIPANSAPAQVIVARHCGIKVFAFTLIVETALDHPKTPPRDMEEGQRACYDLISHMIYYIEHGMLETPANLETLIEDRVGYNAENFYPDLEALQKAANKVVIPVDKAEMEENPTDL